jgi:hypothetical protein
MICTFHRPPLVRRRAVVDVAGDSVDVAVGQEGQAESRQVGLGELLSAASRNLEQAQLLGLRYRLVHKATADAPRDQLIIGG